MIPNNFFCGDLKTDQSPSTEHMRNFSQSGISGQQEAKKEPVFMKLWKYSQNVALKTAGNIR